MDELRSLTDRVQRLEDADAIRALHHTYLSYVDKGWDGIDVDTDGLRRVLTEDVCWGPRSAGPDAAGATRGVEAVIQLLVDGMEPYEFMMHGIQNVRIDVDGDAAQGTNRMWVATRRDGRSGILYLSAFTGYVRKPQGWRINHLDMRLAATAVLASAEVDSSGS